MKKIVTILLSVVMVAAMAVAMTACGETEVEVKVPAKVASATSYALVHKQGYIGQAVTVVDELGNVAFVELNEFFLPDTLFVAIDGTDSANPGASVNQGKYTNTTKAGTKFYAQYVKIGDKYFEGVVNGTAIKYVEINVTGGIADLGAALKPTDCTFASTLNNATVVWYGQACNNAQVTVLKISATGTAIKDSTGAEIKVAYEARANGSSTISKRYGTYGNATYSWINNQKALEAYVLEKGFNFTADDVKRDTDTKIFSIGDVATTATEDDALDYLLLMKDACTKAKTAAAAK